MLAALGFLWGLSKYLHVVGVAQQVRAQGCGPWGCGFESRHSPHIIGLPNLKGLPQAKPFGRLGPRGDGAHKSQGAGFGACL